MGHGTCAASRVPALAEGELVAAATRMYTLTPDRHFLLDTFPDRPQVTLCPTCSGHGFKFATAIGKLVADLVENGSTAVPGEPFTVGRLLGG